MATFQETFTNTTYRDSGATTSVWSGGSVTQSISGEIIDQQHTQAAFYACYFGLSNPQLTNEGVVLGQTFTVSTTSSSLKLTKIVLNSGLYKQGSPADGVKCYIATTSGGLPISTIATSTNTILASSLPQYSVTFTFSPVSLTPGTKYAFYLQRTGATNDSNHYRTYWDTDGGYSGGAWVAYRGSWLANNTVDLEFDQYCQSYSTSSIAQSIKVNTTSKPIPTATLTATATTPAETSVTYYMSSNGGTNWEQVTSGSPINFANVGNDLRWKAVLSGTTTATPSIDTIDITYTIGELTNPANAYADDASYATCAADSGQIRVQLSKDGGTNWTTAKTQTFTTEAVKTYGGAEDTWGGTWTGDDVDNTSFRLRVTCGTTTIFEQDYNNFGFTVAADQIIAGIEVGIKAKYESSTAYINHITAKIYYGDSPLPVEAGSMAYVSDDKNLAFYNGTEWVDVLDSSDTVISIDTISEKTDAAGVTVDGLLIKDGMISHPYKAMAHLSASQTINDATLTLIAFNTEDYDPNGNFNNTAGNYKYVAPITGYYQVNCNVYIKDVTEKCVVVGLLVLRDETIISSQYQVPYPGSSVTTGWCLGYSQVIYLTAGQAISFKGYIDTSDSGTGAVMGGVDGSCCSFHLLST